MMNLSKSAKKYSISKTSLSEKRNVPPLPAFLLTTMRFRLLYPAPSSFNLTIKNQPLDNTFDSLTLFLTPSHFPPPPCHLFLFLFLPLSLTLPPLLLSLFTLLQKAFESPLIPHPSPLTSLSHSPSQHSQFTFLPFPLSHQRQKNSHQPFAYHTFSQNKNLSLFSLWEGSLCYWCSQNYKGVIFQVREGREGEGWGMRDVRGERGDEERI